MFYWAFYHPLYTTKKLVFPPPSKLTSYERKSVKLVKNKIPKMPENTFEKISVQRSEKYAKPESAAIYFRSDCCRVTDANSTNSHRNTLIRDSATSLNIFPSLQISVAKNREIELRFSQNSRPGKAIFIYSKHNLKRATVRIREIRKSAVSFAIAKMLGSPETLKWVSPLW